MNILITTFSFPSLRDGIYDGSFVLAEAIAYAQNGANVKILTPHYSKSATEELIHPGIKVIRFNYFRPKYLQCLKQAGKPLYDNKSLLGKIQIPFLLLSFFFIILRYARWADIIHAQWTLTALLALPAKWLFRTKLITTARGSDIRLLPKIVNKFIHKHVDAIIDCFGVQRWINENRKNFPGNYVRLPLIVNATPNSTPPQDWLSCLSQKPYPFTILYVGRLVNYKIENNNLPIFDLLEVSQKLKNLSINFHLFYIGSGETKVLDKIRHLIDERSLKDHVTLLGSKNNVMDYVYQCDLGAGGIAFNGVSQEFNISGKPQILIDNLDNQETPWRDGYNAIMVKPHDVDSLTKKIITLLSNTTLQKQLVHNMNMEMRDYFSNTHSGGKLYLDAFNKIIQSK